MHPYEKFWLKILIRYFPAVKNVYQRTSYPTRYYLCVKNIYMIFLGQIASPNVAKFPCNWMISVPFRNSKEGRLCTINSRISMPFGYFVVSHECTTTLKGFYAMATFAPATPTQRCPKIAFTPAFTHSKPRQKSNFTPIFKFLSPLYSQIVAFLFLTSNSTFWNLILKI